jgi:6-phosphogluconate dehydrogenase (decarboxylating)
MRASQRWNARSARHSRKRAATVSQHAQSVQTDRTRRIPDAHRLHRPRPDGPVITLSLQARFRSRQDESYGAKMLAARRNEFGGHAVKTE